MRFSPLISLAAGLASAIVFVGGAISPGIGKLLVLFAPMPIAIAGFGWNWLTALAATLLGASALALVSNAPAVGQFLTLIGPPMVVATYLLSFNRELTSDTGARWVQHYPVGHVLAVIGVMAGAIATLTIAILSNGFDEAAYRAIIESVVKQFFDTMTEVNPKIQGQITPDAQKALSEVTYSYLPGGLAMLFLWIIILNLWLGAGVAAKSGRLQRPWPNFSTLVLPRTFPIWFIAAAAGSFLSGLPGLVASAFATAFVMVYALIGLAIVFQATRGWSLAVPVRIFAVAALLFITRLFSLMLATLALTEPFAPWRRLHLEDRPPPEGEDAEPPPPA